MIPLLLLTLSAGPVDDARAAIERGEIEEAITTLESLRGPRVLEETVARYEALGIAYALAGDERAVQAYAKLLAIAPAHALPYTLSPKATFPFERARRQASARAATTLKLEHPEVGTFDEATRVTVELAADPEDWVEALELCHVVKGASEPSCERRAAPALGESARFSLPAIPAREEGVVLQVSLSAFDASGQEIFRGPTRARPLELPVGFRPPGTWIGNPWIWVGVGVAATLGLGLGLAAIQPQTDQLRVVVPE